MNAKPRWRRLQFSLGSFFAILTVCGLWFGAYVNSAHRQRDAVIVLRKKGSLPSYDYPYYDRKLGPRAAPQRSVWRDWIITHFGEDYAANVDWLKLAIEAKKDGEPHSIANERLTLVSRLTQLTWLDLEGADVTDEGLVHLQGLRKLKRLCLSSTRISDDGLAHLAELENLEGLSLHNTQVSDKGLKHLRKLSKLRGLILFRTRVTEAGVKELKKSLPSCQIGF